MKIKIDKLKLEEIVNKLFDTVYDIDRVSSSNLDGYINYFTEENIRLQIRIHNNNKKYLGYYKKDMNQILNILPLSNYMFDKLIMKWFIKKYDVNIDSVLKPLR